jgi:hypothetical protein
MQVYSLGMGVLVARMGVTLNWQSYVMLRQGCYLVTDKLEK